MLSNLLGNLTFDFKERRWAKEEYLFLTYYIYVNFFLYFGNMFVYDISCGFVSYSLIMLMYVPSIPNVSRVFNHKEMLNFVDCFSASIEIIT